jgi:hypothetical protein
LFEACEGRTARKGARGEQVGKLARISTAPKETLSKKAKKDKKKKVSKK